MPIGELWAVRMRPAVCVKASLHVGTLCHKFAWQASLDPGVVLVSGACGATGDSEVHLWPAEHAGARL
jgi:hypothetical protein